ncbi:MAG TPA: sugar phosphate isomerase/epimerase family protein [Capillimicrobium sp.]|nr:sugar phosphate isomerase/epimerase family protein [Capillimicrobium sp.]
MKLGIDSYSFHRYFGEVYPDLQEDPGKTWDMLEDFVPYAVSQNVDEVAIESIFFPVFDDDYCRRLASALDDAGLERILGWGHPDGLHAGTDEGALEDLKQHVPRAKLLGARIMRIVASSMIHVDEPREPQIADSIRMLKEAAQVAEEHGVVLALENHIDFTGPEMLQIVEGVGSDNLRVNLDTGNPIRVYEDPVECARVLAPYVVSTHTKDVTTAGKGGSPADRFPFFPSCPTGQGVVDFEGVASVLADAGFTGSLAVEVDLIAQPWADKPEEEIVAESVEFLRGLLQRHSSAVGQA